MDTVNPLVGDTLELRPLSAEALAAWAAADGEGLRRATGALFPDPPAPPPLMEDALPFMRDRLRAHPDEFGLWAWLCVLRAGGEAVGSAGFGGHPDEDGFLVLGYAIRPEFEGAGLATEAAGLLTAWGLARPGVAGVRITAAADNPASRRVAAKAGFTEVGRARDEEVGELVVLERRGPAPLPTDAGDAADTPR
ncbi:GNAT family N-acetyltransferase (plasmid) [Streptomyces sp. BI20]|uniref:GNAT family N-acetyltransferase n=1 Tax=Streptomyces sp. BI20 TaxID=3403460 RepID=UPI003C766A5A